MTSLEPELSVSTRGRVPLAGPWALVGVWVGLEVRAWTWVHLVPGMPWHLALATAEDVEFTTRERKTASEMHGTELD